MNWVLIASGSRYPVSRQKIKRFVLQHFEKIGLTDSEVSIAFVGSRKITELNKKWRELDEETTVLTFAPEEPRGPDGILRIGDIVICYPQARTIASQDNLLMQEAIEKLLVHGLNNLLGNIKNADNFLPQIPTAKLWRA